MLFCPNQSKTFSKSILSILNKTQSQYKKKLHTVVFDGGIINPQLTPPRTSALTSSLWIVFSLHHYKHFSCAVTARDIENWPRRSRSRGMSQQGRSSQWKDCDSSFQWPWSWIIARDEGLNFALPGRCMFLCSCPTVRKLSSESPTSEMDKLFGKTIAIHRKTAGFSCKLPFYRWDWFEH